ncbi:MAG TPA: flagellar regulator YcgR PilZN domain-containing protein [Gammaproteobacteria bacterium]|nr:flagellar regulator YcgR PilZN domain-containing protein [Gammaproteobacteria bacterium]
MAHRAGTEGQIGYQTHNERITHPGQMLSLLRRVQESRELLTVSLSDDPHSYTSAILRVDPDTAHFLLDELKPATGHERLLTAGSLRASCRHRGIEISFIATLQEVGMAAGIAFYRMGLPEVIHYQQRRAHFRVPVGRALALPVHLTLDGQNLGEGEVRDLSVGGLGIRVSGPVPLERGQIVDQCAIAVPDGPSILTQVEVRFISRREDAAPAQIGARFLNLTRRDQNRLERLVTRLERELIRKRSRD